ncbi:MAG: hypothetical protein WAW99_05665 [Candidatus Bipolaricaulis anaerobius]
MKTRQGLFLGLLVLGSLIMTGCQMGESQSRQRTVEQATNPIRISASDLLAAYSTPASGDLRYKDKVLSVTGRVAYLGDASSGSYTVYLHRDVIGGGVACYFDAETQRTAVARVRVGDTITVRGYCTGMLFGSVVLRACVLER